MTTLIIQLEYWSLLSTYKFMVILYFGPTWLKNNNFENLCHVLLLFYANANKQFNFKTISVNKKNKSFEVNSIVTNVHEISFQFNFFRVFRVT